MLNDIINVVNLNSNVINQIISSELYIDIEKLYEPNIVVKDPQWFELCENHGLTGEFKTYNIINKIYNFYLEIKELIDSSSIKWITSFQIKKDDLFIIDLFLKNK